MTAPPPKWLSDAAAFQRPCLATGAVTVVSMTAFPRSPSCLQLAPKTEVLGGLDPEGSPLFPGAISPDPTTRGLVVT